MKEERVKKLNEFLKCELIFFFRKRDPMREKYI